MDQDAREWVHLAGSNSIVLTSLTRQLIDAGKLNILNGNTLNKKENTMTKSNEERIRNLREKLNIYKGINESDEIDGNDVANLCNDLGIGDGYSTSNVLHTITYDSRMKDDVQTIDCILKCLEENYKHIIDDVEKMIDCLYGHPADLKNYELRGLRDTMRSKFISVGILLREIELKKEAFVRVNNIIKFGTPIDLDKMEEIVGK